MYFSRLLSLFVLLCSFDSLVATHTYSKALISGRPSTPSEVTLSYIFQNSTADGEPKGTVVLIHGFPQSSYQYRHVISPLAEAGYNVVAPDLRGAGYSSKPVDGYDKTTLAEDIHQLVTVHLGITDKVHMVGHDMGALVAYVYASRYANETASIVWGECTLPGSQAYDEVVQNEFSAELWHFVFHWQSDLPEALTAGKEHIYLSHFYRRLSYRPSAFTAEDVNHYVSLFQASGGMRAGFNLYRGFHQDAEDNKRWWREHGKCDIPALSLAGAESSLGAVGDRQSEEAFEQHETAEISNAGHWVAEENPEEYIQVIIEWLSRHTE